LAPAAAIINLRFLRKYQPLSLLSRNRETKFSTIPEVIGYDERGIKTANGKIQKEKEQTEAQPVGG
jgi:hypothetical protein